MITPSDEDHLLQLQGRAVAEAQEFSSGLVLRLGTLGSARGASAIVVGVVSDRILPSERRLNRESA